MDFDLPNLAVTILASLVGFAYFRYAKRQNEMRFAIIGGALMAYSYLPLSLVWNILIGMLLAAVPFTVWK